jgi:hypothetical protein
MKTAGRLVAEAFPNGRFVELEGETHDVSIAALAPVLRDFFSGRG